MFDKMAPQFLEDPGRAAEQGIDAIPGFAEQIVAIHSVIVLGMSNHWFNGRASLEQLAQLWREISSACDIDRNGFRMIALPAKPLIDKRFLGPDSRDPLNLSQGRFQGCSIIRIVVCGIDANNPAPP
jgi:hypothetical protein